MAIFLRETEREKEGKERKKGGGEEGKSLPFSPFASRLYFLPPPPPPCFVFYRRAQPRAVSFLLSISSSPSSPPPLSPDEINDGINDTALNIGDQPVSQLASMEEEDRFEYPGDLPAKVSRRRRSMHLPLSTICLS